MMKPVRTIGLAVLLVTVLGGVLIGHAMGRDRRVATDTDSYHVAAKRLRAELTKTGIPVRYLRSHMNGMPVVSGKVLSHSSSRIGFEYEIFQSAEQATVVDLGKLKASNFGWPKERLGVDLEAKVRGVLGNVAFAEYEWRNHWDRRHYSRNAMLRSQLAMQHAKRALDDALFNSFPPEDPYANALSTTP